MGKSKPTASTVEHGMLNGRGEPDQHPQSAITGLSQALTDLFNISAAKYAVPGGGIPSSDMTAAVQALLTAAGTAYQKPGTGIPSGDLAAAVQTLLTAAGTAYQKPGTGIPSTDLAAAVQTLLTAAGTAYQKPGGGIPDSDFATAIVANAATPDSIVKRKGDGTIAGAITGDAATVGGYTGAQLKKNYASGSYSGDGTTANRQINVGFQPKNVRIVTNGSGSNPYVINESVIYVERVSTSNGVRYIGYAVGNGINQISVGVALNATGFVTGTAPADINSLNTSGITYHWEARD